MNIGCNLIIDSNVQTSYDPKNHFIIYACYGRGNTPDEGANL